MTTLSSTLILISHFLIGFYFTFFGLWNIYHWTPMIEIMTKKRIPSPFFVLSIAIGWQIIAGVMIIVGIFIPLAALLLIPFVLFIVFILHPFWEYTGELRNQHMALFVTNFSVVLAALLLLLTYA